MSRIGKNPIEVPSGATVTVDGQTVKVKGPKGELSLTLVDEVTAKVEDGALTVAPVDDSQRARAMWGMQRSLVANMVEGVTKGFERKLEINGVGYRAAVQGKNLQLAVGYSHDVVMPLPEGIQAATPRPVEIVLNGIDKQALGQFAANVRKVRPPEPYKGKGIKYAEETIFRKEGKKK